MSFKADTLVENELKVQLSTGGDYCPGTTNLPTESVLLEKIKDIRDPSGVSVNKVSDFASKASTSIILKSAKSPTQWVIGTYQIDY